jgi:endonuclease/exonuclease/phosphatase family metal-dependent hydrolase
VRPNNPILVVVLVLAVVLLAAVYLSPPGQQQPGADPSSAGPGQPTAGYLLCFWNCENLFDDHFDNRPSSADKPYDRWFADDAKARELKYGHLADALVKLNDGRGPDILAVVELESERSAEMLREALNARLADPALHYTEPLIKEVEGGRHIAPAVLTRLHARRDRTQLLGKGKRLRILEIHLEAGDHELVLVASHWTSRLSDDDGHSREKYADQIHGRYAAMVQSNPKVDFLVCGDFNDPPDAPSVTRGLHAGGDAAAVRRGGAEAPLLDLFANKSPDTFGTIYHKREWSIFDQIAVSPGLLDDEGWTCDVDSVATINTLTADNHGHPKAFGNEHFKGRPQDRGASDHFPVTVRLRVAGR